VTFITDFADQAVVLPLALAIGIGLLAQGWRQGATAWALAIGATLAMVLVLKVAFIACGTEGLRTPSGHVAAATVVSGGLAALLIRWRVVVLPLAVFAAAVIGATRIGLNLHSPAEVIIGGTVGLAGAWILVKLAGRVPPGFNARRLGLIALAVVLIFHGMHLPAEAHIRSTAWRVAHWLAVCQPEAGRL
jgi:membrane-associated phospholipid phosphatase